MKDPREVIRRYVLDPDRNGLHLRQLVERMAARELSDRPSADPRVREEKLGLAAEAVSRFIHLVWGKAGPEEYAPRTYEMLVSLRDRMRGMPADSTWEYALSSLGDDIRMRLKKAGSITIDPDMETGLTHRFFDEVKDHEYLHDVAEKVMDLHWKRRHGPEAITCEETGRPRAAAGPRGDPAMELHLRRVALEGLATYIEQANIARGNIENPTDPNILSRDRMQIQQTLGARDARTWEESGWRIADQIERRFGTSAARKAARQARAGWSAAAGQATAAGQPSAAQRPAKRPRQPRPNA
jgi:hypothetical protein